MSSGDLDMVRAGGDRVTPIKKILCPVDCSEGSRQALDYALFAAKQFSAEVHILHVWHVSTHVRPDLSVWMEAHGQQPISVMVALEAKAETERFLASVDEPARSAIRVHVLEGEPSRTITELADREHFDLIVIGTQGRPGLMHLALGSVAVRVVRHAHCPVLTVRIPKKA
jgi:nucleotide-binding universal stress UspA family protein